MSPLSNSVYSSVFTYNPNVLTRQYRHLTTKALIEPHHIMCITICVLMVRFGDRSLACRVDTLRAIRQQTRHPSTDIFWLFNELSDTEVVPDFFAPTPFIQISENKLWYRGEFT